MTAIYSSAMLNVHKCKRNSRIKEHVVSILTQFKSMYVSFRDENDLTIGTVSECLISNAQGCRPCRTNARIHCITQSTIFIHCVAEMPFSILSMESILLVDSLY